MDVDAAIRDLQARVRRPRAGRRAPRHEAVRPTSGLVDALRERTEATADSIGMLTYAGFCELGGDALAWQMAHSVRDLLALDEGALARQLAAIASPVRIRILRRWRRAHCGPRSSRRGSTSRAQDSSTTICVSCSRPAVSSHNRVEASTSCPPAP